MGFFDDAWKALDGFGQEAGKHIGPVVGEAWKHMDEFGQNAGREIGPAAGEVWKALDGFGQEAGRHIGPAMGEAWKHMDEFGQNAGREIGPIARKAKDWIVEHPGETAGLVACVAAAPIVIAVTSQVLTGVGFTRAGIAAGSIAAAHQASIGNIAAGTTFAVLQSAGAGGAGAVAVNGVVGSVATAVAVAATAPAVVKAVLTDKEKEELRKKQAMEASVMVTEDKEKEEDQIFELADEEPEADVAKKNV